jgi:hypothetical protein
MLQIVKKLLQLRYADKSVRILVEHLINSKMKKIVFLFLLGLGLNIGAYAQTQSEVEALLSEYEEAMKQKEWLKSLDYIYPALFDVVPREMMEETLEQSFNSPDFSISFEDLTLTEVSDIYEETDLSYCFASYSLVMSMTLAGEKTEEEIAQFADMMALQLGEESISVKDKAIIITQDNAMAVLKKAGDSQLYLLELNPQLKQIMASFMSEEFLERAFGVE